VDPVAWNGTPEPSWSTLREPEPKLRATVAEAEPDVRKTGVRVHDPACIGWRRELSQ
jgi:hypothetical protein